VKRGSRLSRGRVRGTLDGTLAGTLAFLDAVRRATEGRESAGSIG
jgi:hypothetical protein